MTCSFASTDTDTGVTTACTAQATEAVDFGMYGTRDLCDAHAALFPDYPRTAL